MNKLIVIIKIQQKTQLIHNLLITLLLKSSINNKITFENSDIICKTHYSSFANLS
jgi:hypothetical protein